MNVTFEDFIVLAYRERGRVYTQLRKLNENNYKMEPLIHLREWIKGLSGLSDVTQLTKAINDAIANPDEDGTPKADAFDLVCILVEQYASSTYHVLDTMPSFDKYVDDFRGLKKPIRDKFAQKWEKEKRLTNTEQLAMMREYLPKFRRRVKQLIESESADSGYGFY
jgi:DNA anti-recombination protein RmuC